MINNVKSGVYTRNDKEYAFNFYTSLRAVDKMKFVNSVINLLIEDNYNSIIRDLIFDFEIIDIFTDVDITEIENSNEAISLIENLVTETNIVDIVKANIETGLLEKLNQSIDENIEYRTGIHRNPIMDTLNRLLQTVEEKLMNIDTDEMMKMAQMVSGISGELTPEKILEAYSKSDMFKLKYKELLTERAKHDKAFESTGNAIKKVTNNKANTALKVLSSPISSE